MMDRNATGSCGARKVIKNAQFKQHQSTVNQQNGKETSSPAKFKPFSSSVAAAAASNQ